MSKTFEAGRYIVSLVGREGIGYEIKYYWMIKDMIGRPMESWADSAINTRSLIEAEETFERYQDNAARRALADALGLVDS